MDIGLVAAFLGGILALLSPCSALLLPAFFASSVGSGARLVMHTVVFYVGMLVLLIPLGLGVGVLGQLFQQYRTPVIIAAAVLLMALGLLQIFGVGFDPSKFMPGSDALQKKTTSATGLVKSVLLGMTSGLAGVCAGPILGSVLTLAATSDGVWSAAGLLAVYGAGMVIPLLIIAMLWQKLGRRGQRALRGRPFTVLGREFHTTSVITGVLIFLVGVLFWTTNGLVAAPELVPSEAQLWLQEQASKMTDVWVDIIVIVAAAVLLLWWWFRRQAKAQRQAEAEADVDREKVEA